MSDDPSPRQDGPQRRNQEPQFNWKGFLLLAVVVLLVGSGLMVGKEATRAQEVTYRDFVKFVEEDRIDRELDLKLVQQDTTSAEYIEGYVLRSKAPGASAEGEITPPKLSPSSSDSPPSALTRRSSTKFTVPVS
ncbi:MAG: hypothetical protein LDL31_11035, partial [Prosthecobacter sp.]|nr:hypothetical protein [Prosthecobacter sp.]